MIMAFPTTLLAVALIFILALSNAEAHGKRTKCTGSKKYKVTFHMRWTKAKFGNTVPENAHFSPLTAAAHKNRYSPFAKYAYATKEVEMVAESGNNMMLKEMLMKNSMVGDVAALSKPTSNNGPASVTLKLDGDEGFTQVSAIGMLAPTPDWVAFINNVDLCYKGKWTKGVGGYLYGWDAGTEKIAGENQEPQQNIYRLQSPRYPSYEKYPVGVFHIKAI